MTNLSKEHFLTILAKYNRGEATTDEKKYLETHYELMGFDSNVLDEISEEGQNKLANRLKESINTSIDRQTYQIQLNKKQQIYRWSAVAAMLFIAITIGYITNRNSVVVEQFVVDISAHDYDKIIKPGSNRAVLTLSDGSKVLLDSISSGRLANQAGVNITKTARGNIVYEGTQQNGKHTLARQMNNVLTTPNGGFFQIDLPDGTKVWLNAASSLSFPVEFGPNERIVDLKGEAYFEVSHDREKPFFVKTNNQLIEVLGTHFNVRSYENEVTRTALITGSVRVKSVTSKGVKVLKPGQQAVSENGKLEVSNVDINQALAWRDGYFKFKNENIESIMKEVSRWYNVQVEFQEGVKNKKFWGKIPRTSKLSDLLRKLELTKAIHFKIISDGASGKERRIIVMP